MNFNITDSRPARDAHVEVGHTHSWYQLDSGMLAQSGIAPSCRSLVGLPLGGVNTSNFFWNIDHQILRRDSEFVPRTPSSFLDLQGYLARVTAGTDFFVSVPVPVSLYNKVAALIMATQFEPDLNTSAQYRTIMARFGEKALGIPRDFAQLRFMPLNAEYAHRVLQSERGRAYAQGAKITARHTRRARHRLTQLNALGAGIVL